MATVLVIDDEADVLELVQNALESRGIHVEVASDDRTAAQIIENRRGEFEALVADINLGVGVTGFDIARQARQLNPDLKVIYITGHASHLDKFGVPDSVMVPKPFYPNELADRVVDLIWPEDSAAGGKPLDPTRQ
jgi:DNA-binding response OmpR family regulator